MKKMFVFAVSLMLLMVLFAGAPLAQATGLIYGFRLRTESGKRQADKE